MPSVTASSEFAARGALSSDCSANASVKQGIPRMAIFLRNAESDALSSCATGRYNLLCVKGGGFRFAKVGGIVLRYPADSRPVA